MSLLDLSYKPRVEISSWDMQTLKRISDLFPDPWGFTEPPGVSSGKLAEAELRTTTMQDGNTNQDVGAKRFKPLSALINTQLCVSGPTWSHHLPEHTSSLPHFFRFYKKYFSMHPFPSSIAGSYEASRLTRTALRRFVVLFRKQRCSSMFLLFHLRQAYCTKLMFFMFL